jgi:hypothetical protein
VAVAGKVRGLDADMDVSLSDAEEAFTPFVHDFDLYLVELASELVERHLNGFFPCLCAGVYNSHSVSSSCVPGVFRPGRRVGRRCPFRDGAP